MWRIAPAIAGISFLIAGIGAIQDPDCVSASLGGNRRLIEFVCYHNEREGAMAAGDLGALVSAGGVLLLLIAAWPLLRAIFLPTSASTVLHDRNLYESTVRAPVSLPPPPLSTRAPMSESPVQPTSQLASPPSRASPSSLDSSLPPPFAASTPTAGSSGMGAGDNTKPWISELRELGTLRDDGILSEGEFRAEKERIMKARREQ
jgi:hypothetical protein